MSHPTQKYLRSLPGPELQAWVDTLPGGTMARWDMLWQQYNGRTGFMESGPVFRYALQRAGMVAGTGPEKNHYLKP